jgi:hypothetical protein
MFKTPTSQQITDKAIELIELNGLTTNLEIKTALRKDGFWVFQSDVSKAMNENYESVGLELSNNGSFNTYFKATPITTDDEGDDGLEPFITTVDEDDENPIIEPEPEVEKTKKSKIIGDPEFVGTNTYLLAISHEGVENDLIISSEDNLPKSFGTLVYEVKSKNGGDNWYLYSSNKDIITRHKAIYYVWKVLNYGVDSAILYSELRSTKLAK